MKKIKLGSFLLASACAIGLMGIPQGTAHAGVYTTGSSNAGYSGSAGAEGNYTVHGAGGLSLAWHMEGDGKNSKNVNLTISGALNRWASHNSKAGSFTRHMNGVHRAYLTSPEIRWGGAYSATNRYLIWPVYDVVNKNKGKHFNTWISNGLNPNFVTYLDNNSAKKKNGGIWWKGGQRVDAVDITAYKKFNTPKASTDTRKVLVKVTGGKKTFDNTRKTNKQLYDGNKISAPYGDKSKDGEYNYSKNIKATVYSVKKTTTYKRYSYMSNRPDPHTHRVDKQTYSVKSKNTYGTTFNYDVNGPNAKVKSYVPVNLNKSTGNRSLMNSQEDKNLIQRYMREYTGSDGNIDINANNMKGITNGDRIKTLDTNYPTDFQITWNNDQFGLPIKVEDKMPGGGWSYSRGNTGTFRASGNYTNKGRGVNADESNTQYYGPLVSAGIDGGGNASLAYNHGKEYAGSHGLTIARPKAGQKDTLTFRTIMEGNYQLSNAEGSIPFMVLHYNAGMKYKYGVEYGGNVTKNGFNAPWVNGNFYETNAAKNVRQPILYGIR